jgi:hypothetical protein
LQDLHGDSWWLAAGAVVRRGGDLSQLEPLQLAGLGARQRRQILDCARILVWRDRLLTKSCSSTVSAGLAANPASATKAFTIWPRFRPARRSRRTRIPPGARATHASTSGPPML